MQNMEEEIDEVPQETHIIRAPGVPTTLAELAALKAEATEIIEARIRVITTLRKASIAATSPQDWLLFRSKDGQVTGYLQDAGCDRIRDLWGIEVFGVTQPERVAGADGSFHYLIMGSGRCKLTKQVVEVMEGGRSSTDDFCHGKSGAALELDVRKAARANLDGNIVRELAGLKNVPQQELVAAWAGTGKRIENCRHGRGYGSQREREGAVLQQSDHVAVENQPTCALCGCAMTFIAAGVTKSGKNYAAFWSCPKGGQGRDHEKCTVSDAEWQRTLSAREPGEEG